MKRLVSIPLRVLLPVLLLSCAGSAGLIAWKLNTRLIGAEIESEFLQEATLRVTGLQATLEYLFRKGDSIGVKLEVSGMGTRPDVIAAFVLDEHSRVAASTRYATIDNTADAIVPELPEDLKAVHAAQIAAVRASMKGSMVLSRDRRIAVAYYPLLVNVDKHTLRPTRQGLIVLVLDMQIAKARAFQAARRQAVDYGLLFGGLAACAWVFLHFSLTRRVAELVATTRQLASGDLSARTGVAGSDELAQIAKAFDLMAARIAEDIAEREQAEKQLAQNEHRLRLILDSEPECVKLVAADGGLLEMNPAGLKIIEAGCFDEVRGKSIYDLIAPNSHAAFRALKDAVFQGESRTLEFEIIGLKGTHRWMETHACPLRNTEDEIIAQLAVTRDITERKRTEAELEGMHRQLLETSRKAGMAEVATSVLHNVGNVLNSVNVSASQAAEKIGRSGSADLTRVAALFEQHRENLPAFLASAQGQKLPAFLTALAGHIASEQHGALAELQSLRAHIDHIKEIVAMQQTHARTVGVTEELSPASLLEDALQLEAASLDRHGVEVVRDFAEMPSMEVDKHQALQILVNLIRNAKQAMGEAGARGKCLTLRIRRESTGMSITLADQGAGIPAENLTRIFEHGFTTRKDGHGFGLHSAALAARGMGGSLTAQSDGAGKGAAFTLKLPCAHQTES